MKPKIDWNEERVEGAERGLVWVTNHLETDWCSLNWLGDLFKGEPVATSAYTVNQLKAMGFVGVYRWKDDNKGETKKMKLSQRNESQALAALMAIAQHFEGCDLSDDSSSWYVLQRACKGLGWSYRMDEYNQIVLIKTTTETA